MRVCRVMRPAAKTLLPASPTSRLLSASHSNRSLLLHFFLLLLPSHATWRLVSLHFSPDVLSVSLISVLALPFPQHATSLKILASRLALTRRSVLQAKDQAKMSSPAASYVIFDRASPSAPVSVFRAPRERLCCSGSDFGEIEGHDLLARGVAAFEAARLSRSSSQRKSAVCRSSELPTEAETFSSDDEVDSGRDSHESEALRNICRSLKKLQGIVGGNCMDVATLLSRVIERMKALQDQATLNYPMHRL